MTGKSLELYFVEGRPDGMLTAEVFNWTGHILMTPRIQVAKALTRPEAARTGVYILVGEIDGFAAAYIGEAEELGRRILAGSRARLKWMGNTDAKTSYHKLHRELIDAEILKPEGNTCVFVSDYAFSSTSAAGAVVNGRSTRGPTAWKVKGTDTTFNTWEEQQLQATEAAA